MYANDRSAGEKHKHAQNLIEQLWNSGHGVLSTQVLQELWLNLRRKIQPPLVTDEVRRLIQDYLSWEVVVNTTDSVIEALEIEQRHKISFWNALIVQSALTSGATVLYSENLAGGQRYGPIRVMNPLAGVNV